MCDDDVSDVWEDRFLDGVRDFEEAELVRKVAEGELQDLRE